MYSCNVNWYMKVRALIYAQEKESELPNKDEEKELKMWGFR